MFICYGGKNVLAYFQLSSSMSQMNFHKDSLLSWKAAL